MVSLECAQRTSVSLTCSWSALAGADNYHVTLSDPAADPKNVHPFAISTSAHASVTIEDLVPHTRYSVGVRAHPGDAPSAVWGWADYAAPIVVSTRPSPDGAPHSLRRAGEPATDDFTIEWDGAVDAQVGLLRLDAAEYASDAWVGATDFEWQQAVGHRHTARGLTAGSVYAVRVRRGDAAPASDAVVFRTLRGDGTLHTQAYRISEYQFTVDFLQNHDAASADAMPIYIMDHNPINTSSISPHWDGCQAALPSILPGMHGAGLSCLHYADQHKRPEVTAACGNFSTKDDSVGWDVHWYCGTGWPESVVMSSPITEYCVEHTPAPTVARYSSADGFADYLSCNGDEVDPWGNAPSDPRCICNVWMDRMIGQQPRSRIEKQCGLYGQNGTATEPFVGNEVQCNCSFPPDPRGGVFLEPADPSLRFVGRSPVLLPYLYWVRAAPNVSEYARHPLEHYPVSVPSGFNYVFPTAGACAEGEAPAAGGSGGCTWSRQPAARVLWGTDLQAANWNFSWVQDRPDDMRHTLDNVRRFKELVAPGSKISTAGRFVTPRCCGC
jgi:hypothetical protein